MILEAIDAIIGVITLRKLWKKKPDAVEAAMREAQAQTDEAKKLAALQKAVEDSQKNTTP